PQRNGCSFEDDLSLGAEAHLLQSSSAKPDPSNYDMQALEKRSQFRQKSRSMNSTGSGKSSGTVSSVSELLDLYEEDPEEILYNLGFGREEPDIASKIPSRFFNTSSSAKGIDIKVYLGAQMQRMELENPNYALTSRFRQTEVLATVANVFSEIYSQVSGRPIQKICQKSEAEPTEPPPLRRNSSTLNAVKILKKNLTRPNLMALAEMMSKQPTKTDPEGTKNSVCEPHSDAEPRQKIFRRKDSLLATVTEESNQSGVEVCDSETKNSKLVNGERLSTSFSEKPEVGTDVCGTPLSVSEQSNGEIVETDSSMIPEGQKTVSSSSTPDKEPCPLMPNPHMAHLLSQPRDSFEMEEELQRRLKNLKVFRTQMMDLELALMRQQSMVYQLLTPEERQEAEQLQRLRVAVRQELQELEVQLEDQLLTLDDQIHSAHSSRLSRHLLDMSRGQSMDSLSSSSALRATEPVTDLLREQMYLQSELSYDGTSAVDTPTSARSSRSVSPVRSRDLTSSPSRRRGGVYRSTVSLTPSIPSRSGTETREQTPQRNISPRLPEVTAGRTAQSVSDHTDVNKEPSFQKNKGEEGESGGEEAFGNANIKQLIQQIKKSLADEIRQEIVNEILAAVSPQRSVATQESAP
ncbi:protein ITPRID2 isoform X1, partial [Tachysurus ichikawai]